MTAFSHPCTRGARWRGAAFFVACTATGASASAASEFTVNFGRNGIVFGSPFTADTLLAANYSAVTLSGATFTEIGNLSLTGAQLGGVGFTPRLLNDTYGLYIAFSGIGTLAPGAPGAGSSLGTFTAFDYTLYGYSDPAEFGFRGNTPFVITPTTTALATGSLATGGTSVPLTGGDAFSPATLRSTFVPTRRAVEAGLFAAPSPFYDLALVSFSTAASQVESFDSGFRVRRGNAAITFASSVPEPETWALLLAGLGAIALVTRRGRPG